MHTAAVHTLPRPEIIHCRQREDGYDTTAVVPCSSTYTYVDL